MGGDPFKWRVNMARTNVEPEGKCLIVLCDSEVTQRANVTRGAAGATVASKACEAGEPRRYRCLKSGASEVPICVEADYICVRSFRVSQTTAGDRVGLETEKDEVTT
jgi:hypothetical protein